MSFNASKKPFRFYTCLLGLLFLMAALPFTTAGALGTLGGNAGDDTGDSSSAVETTVDEYGNEFVWDAASQSWLNVQDVWDYDIGAWVRGYYTWDETTQMWVFHEITEEMTEPIESDDDEADEIPFVVEDETDGKLIKATVKMQYGFDLHTLLAKVTDAGTNPAYDTIQELVIKGEGSLNEKDGEFIRANLVNLAKIDLKDYSGSFGERTFAECTALKRVELPVGASLAREMFYGCTSLESLNWPKRLRMANDCFSYCALDFSTDYPSLLNEKNVVNFAANQRPVVYMHFPKGMEGSITAGDKFKQPYQLLTRSGSDYSQLIGETRPWLATQLRDIEVSEVYSLNGERVQELNLEEPGVYTIVYSLPINTPAAAQRVPYQLTILPADGSALPIALTGLPSQVYVGDAFSLSCESEGAEDTENWGWDENFFSASFDSPATFTPLKEGTTTIYYSGPDDTIGELEVTVLPAGSKDSRPGTSNLMMWIIIIVVAVIVLAVILILQINLRRKPNKVAAFKTDRIAASPPIKLREPEPWVPASTDEPEDEPEDDAAVDAADEAEDEAVDEAENRPEAESEGGDDAVTDELDEHADDRQADSEEPPADKTEKTGEEPTADAPIEPDDIDPDDFSLDDDEAPVEDTTPETTDDELEPKDAAPVEPEAKDPEDKAADGNAKTEEPARDEDGGEDAEANDPAALDTIPEPPARKSKKKKKRGKGKRK